LEATGDEVATLADDNISTCSDWLRGIHVDFHILKRDAGTAYRAVHCAHRATGLELVATVKALRFLEIRITIRA
jgi:hypothetical protein